jgi:hypothetical protein
MSAQQAPLSARQCERRFADFELATEFEPPRLLHPLPSCGTVFSWAAASPQEPAGTGDAGSLLFNTADAMALHTQRAASSEQRAVLQLRERPSCHDMHWTERPGYAAKGERGPRQPSWDLEALIGLLSGEVLLWRPLLRREGGNASLVTCVKETGEGCGVTALKWRPGQSREGSESSVFVTGHTHGRLLIFDRLRLDDVPAGSRDSVRRNMRVGGLRRESSAGAGRLAPASTWQASPSGAALHALAFTSDGDRLALATADGLLTVLDFDAIQPLFRLSAYFGGVLSCCWTHDHKYLLRWPRPAARLATGRSHACVLLARSGGEDDLVSVWSVERRVLITRGQVRRPLPAAAACRAHAARRCAGSQLLGAQH